LPDFIERYETDARYAYFGDIARLEWALHRAAFAADATALASAQWQAMGAERLMSVRLAVNPACVALESRFAVFDIWRAHRAETQWPEHVDQPCWTLIVRPQWRPAALAQTQAAHAVFVALQGGATLDTALERGFALDEQFDFASHWRTWIETRAITGLRDD
jgi:hypothetical protein